MESLTLDNNYFITYSNYFEFENRVFAFRKKELFEITNIPIHLPLKENNGSIGYWINRKWLSLSFIQTLMKKEEKTVDVSDLQWYQQIQIDEIFNL